MVILLSHTNTCCEGNFFYTSLIRQSSEHMTKEEYNRSHTVLREVFEIGATLAAVGQSRSRMCRGNENSTGQSSM